MSYITSWLPTRPRMSTREFVRSVNASGFRGGPADYARRPLRGSAANRVEGGTRMITEDGQCFVKRRGQWVPRSEAYPQEYVRDYPATWSAQ